MLVRSASLCRVLSSLLLSWALGVGAGCRSGPDDAPDQDALDIGDIEPGPDTADHEAGAPDGEVAPADAGPEIEPWTPPAPILWPGGAAPELTSQFAAAHPLGLGRLSRFATRVSGALDDRPDTGHRGAFAVGNGHVFALFGLGDPLNSLHGMVGPTYEKDRAFFGDQPVRLAEVGQSPTPEFDEEWAGRSLAAPIGVTGARRGALVLETVDFAPWTEAAALDPCIVRVLTTRNEGTAPSADLELRVEPVGEPDTALPDTLVEVVDGRALVTRFTAPGGVAAEGRLLLPLGTLAPGEERTDVLLQCAQEGAEVGTAAPPVDAGSLLDETTERYAAWDAELLHVTLPDPRVADFIDGMKLTLVTQRAATGATCPMSQYTRTWSRDNIGPVLAMLALGGFDDAAGMLDYIWGAVLLTGDIHNSYAADLDLSALPAQPDWEAKGALPAREAAETPSYLVWTYGAWERYTGQLDRVAERFGLLRRCLLAQGLSAEHLLPFTGDETFRAAMNAAFGLDLETAHHEISWSANSSLLWLGAARHFSRLARHLGADADAEEAEALYPIVEAATLDTYRLADGCFAAFVDRASGAASPPFEDVATKVTWAGWLDGDDEVAQQSVACLMDRLRFAPGVLQSPLDPVWVDSPFLPVHDGVYTGMLPGYTLAALTAAGHPEAAAAFDGVGRSLTTSGNCQEYMIRDDDSGLSLIYDPSGVLPDYTSKYRPWEGGIALHAVLDYLVGFRPDAAAAAFGLRPHLPNDWPDARYEGLRVADDRFELQLTRTAEGARLALRSSAATTYAVALRWDTTAAAAATAPAAFRVDGELLEPVQHVEAFGAGSTIAPSFDVPPGAEVIVEVLE